MIKITFDLYSHDKKHNSITFSEPIKAVKLVKQVSKTPCTSGRYGFYGNKLWVNDGCRGKFEIYFDKYPKVLDVEDKKYGKGELEQAKQINSQFQNSLPSTIPAPAPVKEKPVYTPLPQPKYITQPPETHISKVIPNDIAPQQQTDTKNIVLDVLNTVLDKIRKPSAPAPAPAPQVVLAPAPVKTPVPNSTEDFIRKYLPYITVGVGIAGLLIALKK